MEPMFTRDQLYAGNGHMRSTALFLESCRPTDEPIMTLKSLRPHHKVVSLRDEYIKYCVEDPTEVTFALAVFGEVEFWNKLSEKSWMKRWLDDYRAEVDQRRQSLAFEVLWKEIRDGEKNAYQAAKYLIEEPWKKKDTKKVDGRKKVKEEKPESNEYSADIANLKDFIKNG